MPRHHRFLPALLVAALAAPALGQPDPAQIVAQGLKLQREGQLDGALALYTRAVSQKPDLLDAQLALGKALDLKFSYAAARDHLAKAIELAEGDARVPALAAMANSFAFERRAADAATFYQRAFDLQAARKQLSDAGETANALGRVYLECGDSANARRWYETGYETATRQTNLAAAVLDLWRLRWEHAQARIAIRQGDRAGAARHLLAVKAIVEKGGQNADQWPVYFALEGYVDFHARQDRAAIAALLKADPNDAFVLAMLGQAYERAGDPARARECYEKVMTLLQHSLQVAFARPVAVERLKRIQKTP